MTKRNATWLGLIALVVLWAAASPGTAAIAAAGTWKEIQDSGVLVVGVTDQEPPFGYREEEGGRLVGYDLDFMRAVASHWGLRPRFTVVTQGDRVGALLDGQVDVLAVGLTHNDARGAVMEFSKHYLVSGQKLIARGGVIRSHDDLEGKRIGAVVGTFAESCARDRCKVSRVVPLDDYVEGIEALQDGRIDAFTADEAILVDLFAGIGGGGYEIPDVAILREEYHLAVRKGQAELRDELDRAIDALQANGEAERIRRKWYGTPEELPPPAYGSVVRRASSRPRFLGVVLSGVLVPGADVVIRSTDGQEMGNGTVSSVLSEEFYLDADPAIYDLVRPGFLVTMNMNDQMAMDVLMRRKDVLGEVAAQAEQDAEQVRAAIAREAAAKAQRAAKMDTARENSRISTQSDRARYYYGYGRYYGRRGFRR